MIGIIYTIIKKARGGYKGKLDLPGGGIEFRENPDDTILKSRFLYVFDEKY